MVLEVMFPPSKSNVLPMAKKCFQCKKKNHILKALSGVQRKQLDSGVDNKLTMFFKEGYS